ncbi:MAG: hypothetical protein ABSD77_07445 [Verrucomicrobiota bacterium]|jgi:hypothetical protein
MKFRRLILIASLLVIVAIVICVALVSYWEHSQPKFKDAPKLAAAVQAFSRDRAAHGQPLPTSVSLHELVGGGYIATNDVRAFDGMDVTISLDAGDAYPQSILIHVRMPDGTEIAAMADGSVQQLPKR